jgi:hypothetical protein
MDREQIALLRLLAARLERLSVDSIWARRASGTRGSVLKALERIDAGETLASDQINLLIDKSFDLLRRAAQEIPDLEAIHKRMSGEKK